MRIVLQSAASREKSVVEPVAGVPRMESLEPRVLLSVVTTLSAAGIGGGGWFGPTGINPVNPNEIWMPTDMGEQFHSTDGGATWTYPPITEISAGYHSGVQFTSNPNVMWSINGGGGCPAKSTDGGNTWTNSTSWNNGTYNGTPFFLYTDPNSNFIVCSSVDWGSPTTTNPVWLSTNGGATWGASPIYTGITSSADELIVSGMFKDGSNMWISTSQGILFSSNVTSGAPTFSMLAVPWNASAEDPYSMAVSKSGNTIRFFVVTDNPQVFVYSSIFDASYQDANYNQVQGFQNVYTSDFNTTTQTQGAWTNITSRLPANELPSFAGMASGNINTIYLAGDNNINYGVPGVLKSTDGGLTWTEIFETDGVNGIPNQNIATNKVGDGYEIDFAWGGYALSLDVCQSNANDVIITDMSTAWMTTDGGTGGLNTTAANADWRDITIAPAYLHAPGVMGSPGTTAYAGSADNTGTYNVTFLSPQDVFASMTDNTGVYSTDGGVSWYCTTLTLHSQGYFANFFNVTADSRTDVLFASGGTQNDFYKNWRLPNWNRDGRGGGLDYSTDGGKTWNLLTQWSFDGGSTFNPLAQVVIDTSVAVSAGGRAYALVANSTDGGIWVTNNLYLNGQVNPNCTWTQLAVPSRTMSAFSYGWTPQAYAAGTYYAHDPNQLTILNDGTLVATFDEQYDPTDTYMNPCSGIWISTDGGQSWTDRSDLNLSQSSMMFFTQHMVVDPQDPTQNTWYAAVDFNWNDYRAYNTGVFETTNRGLTWTQIFNGGGTGDGYGNCGCSCLAINPDTGEMYVGSESSGLFYSSDKVHFTPVAAEHYTDIDSISFNPFETSQLWVTTHGNGAQMGYTDGANSPSNLTAVGNQGHQITLNWSAVSGATSYLVQYATGAADWQCEVTWTTYATASAGSTSANIDGLAANMSYYFRIVPQSGGATLGYSNIVSGPVLAASTSVVASADSPYEIDLSWQYSGVIIGAQFEIERSTDSVNWTAIATTADTSTLTYADDTASAGTFYYYRVVTILGATFQSAPSSYSSAKTMAAGGLIAYDGFTYAAGTPLNGQGAAGNNWAGGWTVTADNINNPIINGASLTPPGDLAASNGGSMIFGTVGGTAERDTASTLSSYGTTLWASVLVKPNMSTANLAIGFVVGNVEIYCQQFGGTYEWTTLAPDGSWYGASWEAGPVVTNNTTYFLVLKITYNGGNDSMRAWLDPTPGATAPSNASSYDYISGHNMGGNLTDVRLAASYYTTTAFDEVRLGATYAAVAPLALATAPASVAAAPVTSSQIKLTWANTSSNTAGYNVYRSTDGQTFTQVGSTTSASYTAAGLTAGTTYYFQVTAANASGNESGYSNRVSQMAPIAGDINCDGQVNGADYAIWAANYGATDATWSQGDLNNDGQVNGADYAIWAANYGASAATGDSVSQAALPAATGSALASSTAASDQASVTTSQVETSSGLTPSAADTVAVTVAADASPSPIPWGTQQAQPACSPARRAPNLAATRGDDFDMLDHAKPLHVVDGWSRIDGKPRDVTDDLLASPLDELSLRLI